MFAIIGAIILGLIVLIPFLIVTVRGREFGVRSMEYGEK